MPKLGNVVHMMDKSNGSPAKKIGGSYSPAAPRGPEMIRLRHKPSGRITSHYPVDVLEILRMPDSLYEEVDPKPAPTLSPEPEAA